MIQYKRWFALVVGGGVAGSLVLLLALRALGADFAVERSGWLVGAATSLVVVWAFLLWALRRTSGELWLEGKDMRDLAQVLLGVAIGLYLVPLAMRLTGVHSYADILAESLGKAWFLVLAVACLAAFGGLFFWALRRSADVS